MQKLINTVNCVRTRTFFFIRCQYHPLTFNPVSLIKASETPHFISKAQPSENYWENLGFLGIYCAVWAILVNIVIINFVNCNLFCVTTFSCSLSMILDW